RSPGRARTTSSRRTRSRPAWSSGSRPGSSSLAAGQPGDEAALERALGALGVGERGTLVDARQQGLEVCARRGGAEARPRGGTGELGQQLGDLLARLHGGAAGLRLQPVQESALVGAQAL